MSVLLNSLRGIRRGNGPRNLPSTRTAQTDNVVATLVYPARRDPGFARGVLYGLAIVVLGVAGWVGYRWYTQPGPGQIAPAQPAASRPTVAPPPAPARPEDTPGAGAAEIAAAGAPAARAGSNVTSRPTAAAPSWSSRRTPTRRIDPAATTEIVPPPAADFATADHFKRALYFHRTGDFENALIHYRAIISSNELNAEAHNNLGLLYQDKGLLEEAIREFRRAIFIDQKYVKAHNNLGVALLRSGKVDAAASEFRTALSVDPRNIESIINLALAQKAAGHAEEARQTLMKGILVDSRNPALYYNLGLIFEEAGEAAKAVENYRNFLKYSTVEHATLATDVRQRIDQLGGRMIP